MRRRRRGPDLDQPPARHLPASTPARSRRSSTRWASTACWWSPSRHTATVAGAATTAYGATFDADVALLLSEIDPVQNRAVDAAVRTDGFSDTRVWSGKAGDCGDPAAPVGVVNTCYPPAVNYSPLYYLVNGVAFDRTATASAAGGRCRPRASAGNVLLRLVNAGLRMHVPSVVGASMTLIAEDGNALPGRAARAERGVPRRRQDLRRHHPAEAVGGRHLRRRHLPGLRPRAVPLDQQPARRRHAGLRQRRRRRGAGGRPTLHRERQDLHLLPGRPPCPSPTRAMGVLAGAVGANGAVLGTTTIRRRQPGLPLRRHVHLRAARHGDLRRHLHLPGQRHAVATPRPSPTAAAPPPAPASGRPPGTAAS